MSADRDAVTVLAVLKWFADRAEKARKREACRVRELMWAGESLSARVGKRLIAMVSVARPTTTATVTDDAALLTWVTENRPTEVETITRIRPVYLSLLLQRCKDAGAAVDTRTGEPIPGIEIAQGHPTPRVVLSDDADDVIAEAWRAGELGGLPELLAALASPDDTSPDRPRLRLVVEATESGAATSAPDPAAEG